ncbi:hypothetical protein EVAR_21096_1 [Eumeta japonica]|uniref:Gustatory receptor n=1 Tax=Eumeta variegata TaxID=151549 RepID=A0A4C1V1C0_EUMVA|nr:hypothetical protein EVAR_21096_1 [Eumeta japonica]
MPVFKASCGAPLTVCQGVSVSTASSTARSRCCAPSMHPLNTTACVITLCKRLRACCGLSVSHPRLRCGSSARHLRLLGRGESATGADMASRGDPPIPHLNNYVKDQRATAPTVTGYLTFLSYLEALVGVCRLRGARILRWTAGLYGIALAAAVVVLAMHPQPNDNASYMVFRRTASAEFALLVAVSLLCQRRAAAALDRELAHVERALDPDGARGLGADMARRGGLWILTYTIYYIVEYCIVVLWRHEHIQLSTLMLYIPLLAHDLEQLYFTSLLRMIWARLQLLCTHLPQALTASATGSAPPSGAPEGQRRRPPLDITALHRLYERLHHCAELLNSIMSLPMFITLTSSGISTTFLLKNLVTALQITDAANAGRDSSEPSLPLAYSVLRCVKYTLSVFVPCVYSGLTAAQARILRTQAHDALDDKILVSERTARRKLKALVRLTRERDFTYALWGVVALDMSLPLSYVSLCTTYLSGREIDASQAERLRQSCLSIACSALSLARSAQAERGNESCFFVHATDVHAFIRRYHVKIILLLDVKRVCKPPEYRWSSQPIYTHDSGEATKPGLGLSRLGLRSPALIFDLGTVPYSDSEHTLDPNFNSTPDSNIVPFSVPSSSGLDFVSALRLVCNIDFATAHGSDLNGATNKIKSKLYHSVLMSICSQPASARNVTCTSNVCEKKWPQQISNIENRNKLVDIDLPVSLRVSSKISPSELTAQHNSPRPVRTLASWGNMLDMSEDLVPLFRMSSCPNSNEKYKCAIAVLFNERGVSRKLVSTLVLCDSGMSSEPVTMTLISFAAILPSPRLLPLKIRSPTTANRSINVDT